MSEAVARRERRWGELAAAAGLEGSGAAGAVRVSGVAYDSRKVQAGDVFFALPGAKDDGGRHAAEAVARGARVVVHEGVLEVAGAASVRAADAREAMGRVAAEFYGRPSEKVDVLGVTGTNGKTTTTWLIRHLLERGGEGCGLIGTVKYAIGGREAEAGRTTPESADLQRMFAEAAAAGQGAVAMEVSSQGLVAKRLAGTRVALAVFTNLTPEHLDFHGTMENYYAAKRGLFEALAAGSAAGAAVVNVGDEWGRRLAGEEWLRGRVVRFAVEGRGEGEVRAEGVESGAWGSRFWFRSPWGDAEVRMRLAGRYNVENALGAMACGALRGLEPAAMAEWMAQAECVPGRLERVEDAAGGRHVFVDYAHTPDALENVLKTLREAAGKQRLVCIFGCGGDRDRTKRAPMGAVAAKWADAVVLTSDNPRSEDPERILDEIAAGVPAGTEVFREADRAAAVKLGMGLAGRGDVVLVAGKGHETTQEVNGVKSRMVDCELVADALRLG